MNDNDQHPSARSDPFWLGMAAFRDQLNREACPFPEAHVEARSWSAGWDHGAFRAEEPDKQHKGKVDGQGSAEEQQRDT